jgi:hypothetical protein
MVISITPIFIDPGGRRKPALPEKPLDRFLSARAVRLFVMREKWETQQELYTMDLIPVLFRKQV